MDVPRPPGRRRGFGIAVALFTLVLAAALTVLLSRLEPAAPAVARDLLVLSEVHRGPLLLELRAWGELAPEGRQPVEAAVSARVVAVDVTPGETVRAGAVLVELASPDLALETAKAEQEYTAARAAFLALRRSLGTQRLEREAKLADMRSAREASREVLADVDRRAARGESVELEQVGARDLVRSLDDRIAVEEEMLALLESTGREQIELEKKRLAALADVLARERVRLDALRVRAPVDAVVETVLVETGAWVRPGTELLRLLHPERMRAELSVPAPLAGKIRPGLEVAVVDAAGDTLSGTVGAVEAPKRVAVEVQPGPEAGRSGGRHTGAPPVRVSVRLRSVPDVESVADAGVSANIRLGRLEEALSVKRPAWASEGASGSVFRVGADGSTAERVKVRFGLGSHDRIEVLSGLEEGDVVIVSDMSRYHDVPCVRLKP